MPLVAYVQAAIFEKNQLVWQVGLASDLIGASLIKSEVKIMH